MGKIINKNTKRIIAAILTLAIVFTSVRIECFTIDVKANTTYTTIYLIDNTSEHWLGNDNAVFELVDNTHGHDYYTMTMIDDSTWSVNVPTTTYNVTFNRLNPNNNTQWNSWSAGGRDSNNTYYVDGSEYGHWETIEEIEVENYFHAGDIIYLDLSEFTDWEKNNALIHVNFTNASKDDNGGKDININNVDVNKFCPKLIDYEVDEHIYAYIVSKQDEGKDVLRFWRGNDNTLWNSSIEIRYEQYQNKQNCIVVNSWDNHGYYSYYFNAKTCLDSLLKVGYIDKELYNEMLDVDGDLLSIEEEYKYGTSPSEADSDFDGLSDYEEIYIYGTNPTNVDTDNDGMSDGTEIRLGLNPLIKDSNNNGVDDGEEIFQQSVCNKSFENIKDNTVIPKLNITGKGDYSLKVNVKDISNNEIFQNMDYMLGAPYDFIHDEGMEFDECELVFSINEEISNIDELAIAYYDENTNEIEFIKTIADTDNNTLSCTVEHLSIYFIVDVTKFISGWYTKNLNDVVIKGKADIAFIIDTTGSMSNAISQVKNSIESFADELEENKVDVRLGLIEYKDIYYDGINSTKCYGWFENVSNFKNKVNSLVASGGGDAPETLVDAINIMQINLKFRNDADKYAIIVTDASYKEGCVNDAEETLGNKINQLIDKNINVSVITKSNLYNTYSELVNRTKGVLGNIDSDFKDTLNQIVTTILDDIEGKYWIRLSNGSVVCLDSDPNLGNSNIDTDGDGISDINELKEKIKYKFDWLPDKIKEAFDISTEIETWTFYSNPALKDTDGDGVSDDKDIEPCVYQPYEFGLNAYEMFLLKILYNQFEKNYYGIQNYEFCRCIASISYGDTTTVKGEANLILWSAIAGLYIDSFIRNVMISQGLSTLDASDLFNAIRDEHILADVNNNIDLSHMMATMSCSLYDGNLKNLGAVGGVSLRLHGTVEDYAGYYGDVFGTLFAEPNMGNADYMSDLDAVNILDRMKYNDNMFEVMENYYADINNGRVNRAYEFMKNTSGGTYQDGLAELLATVNTYYDVANYYESEIRIKNARNTACNFMLNMLMQNNEYIMYKEILSE